MNFLAAKLASVIASTVLAGELSLMSSLVKGDLVKSHLKLNRISSKPPPKVSVLINLKLDFLNIENRLNKHNFF